MNKSMTTYYRCTTFQTTQEYYCALLKIFVCYLVDKGITNFNDVKRTDIGQFLSSKRKPNTRNRYIFLIKSFYKNYLGNDKLFEHLHQKPEEETITPSELLTPDEVAALANEAGKKRDLYQLLSLLFAFFRGNQGYEP